MRLGFTDVDTTYFPDDYAQTGPSWWERIWGAVGGILRPGTQYPGGYPGGQYPGQYPGGQYPSAYPPKILGMDQTTFLLLAGALVVVLATRKK